VQVEIATIVALAVLAALLVPVEVQEDQAVLAALLVPVEVQEDQAVLAALAVLATDLADMANPLVQEEANLANTVMTA